MHMRLFAALTALLLAACGEPRDVTIPSNPNDLDRIQPSINQLPEDERGLLSRYILRYTSEGNAIPKGTTIGLAIGEQRRFDHEAALEDAKRKQMRESAIRTMQEAVTVSLVSKNVEMGGATDPAGYALLTITVQYKNNTNKNIAGIKGHISITDLFGSQLSEFDISNDNSILANGVASWTGSKEANVNEQSLARIPLDKLQFVWQPKVLVFEDGTRLVAQ